MFLLIEVGSRPLPEVASTLLSKGEICLTFNNASNPPTLTRHGTIGTQMAPHFDLVARFHILPRDTDILEARATGGFKGPHLGFALGIADFEVDPGMWDNQMDFLNHTLEIG